MKSKRFGNHDIIEYFREESFSVKKLWVKIKRVAKREMKGQETPEYMYTLRRRSQ